MTIPFKNIGYVGMGIMGAPMAMNLIKAGFKVTVWNRTKEKCDPLRQAGAEVAESPAALAASGVDVIFINVTDTPDVEHVLFGEDGIASAALPGLIVIDNSTINPIQTREFSERLAMQEVCLLDAPVSGGDIGAKQGTLSIMIGGPTEQVEQCMPLFAALGDKINHMGESGAGQLCKACNQVAVSCSLMGTVEAMALAQRGGLDLNKMVDVVSGGAGGSWQLKNLGPKIADRDYAPGFMIDLILKDLAIVQRAAAEYKLELSGLEQALQYFKQAAEQGHGKDGTQAIASNLV